MIAEFEKRGRLKWFSHLDLQRAMLRALRRANIPVAYSQGFNPHANLSFASALSVGLESVCEIMDIQLAKEMEPAAFVEAMNKAMPQELKFMRARLVEDAAPAPMALMQTAMYEAFVEGRDLSEEVSAFLEKEECLVQKRSKKKMREVNIRPMVHVLSAEQRENGCVLHMALTCTNADNLKPELLLEALCEGVQANIIRKKLLLADGRDLFDF